MIVHVSSGWMLRVNLPCEEVGCASHVFDLHTYIRAQIKRLKISGTLPIGWMWSVSWSYTPQARRTSFWDTAHTQAGYKRHHQQHDKRRHGPQERCFGCHFNPMPQPKCIRTVNALIDEGSPAQTRLLQDPPKRPKPSVRALRRRWEIQVNLSPSFSTSYLVTESWSVGPKSESSSLLLLLFTKYYLVNPDDRIQSLVVQGKALVAYVEFFETQ